MTKEAETINPLALVAPERFVEYVQLQRDKLKVGQWYVGQGRNGNIGLWDGEYFLVLAQVGIKVGPGSRDWETQPGIKREPYFEPDTGCFQPFKAVDMGVVRIPLGERNYALKMAFDIRFHETS